jgi:hypothetical protein
MKGDMDGMMRHNLRHYPAINFEEKTTEGP